MSTLTVTNIKATGETASRAVSGVAAAWVNFNGTGTIATRDSVNVSSLSDQGTGDHHVNLTNAMSSVNNASATDCNNGDGGYNRNGSVAFATTSRLDLLTYNTGTNALTDLSHNMGSVHGDLA